MCMTFCCNPQINFCNCFGSSDFAGFFFFFFQVKICMAFACNPQMEFRHIFCSLKYIGTGYLVNATPTL